jgi:serine/threonine-protein kinase ULK/ATG1
LDQFMKKNGPVSEAIAQKWFCQLLDAFDELLRRNVIHRDLKLANILLTTNDSATAEIKVADFGFARYLTENSMAVTQCGSPLYMAPEIFKAKPNYNYKADIWSLGAILFEILIGTAAF